MIHNDYTEQIINKFCILYIFILSSIYKNNQLFCFEKLKEDKAYE